MNIYKISRPNDVDYDEYDSAIVIARTYHEARTLHPDGSINNGAFGEKTWVESKKVIVDLIGVADEDFRDKCVILASYNVG